MKIKIDQTKISLLFLLLCAGLNWTGPGHAFEAWNGEVTTNANLRKSPGLEGNIFAGLRKGDRVLIIDRHEDWYQIAIETDSYGYKGWVFGKYLKRLEREEEGLSLEKEKRPGPLVPSQEKISQERNSPELIQGEKREAQEEKGFETTSSVAQIVLQSETNEENQSKRPDTNLFKVSPPSRALLRPGQRQKQNPRKQTIGWTISIFKGSILSWAFF